MTVKRHSQPKSSVTKTAKTGSKRPVPRRPKLAPHDQPYPTEDKLRESEERYRLISEVASDYVFSTRLEDDGSLQLNWVAGAFEAITGYTFEEYRARGGWRAAIHPQDLEIDARDLQLLQQNRNVISTVRTIKKDGTVVWAQVYAHPIWDEHNRRLIGIYGAVQDVTARKQAENELHRKNRALLIHSACSQALAHINDEAELLTQICKICIELGGYRLAWIGYAEEDAEKTVRPIAYWGFALGYLEKLKISWADSEFGQGPSGKAIRTRQPQIAQNILAAPEYLPWRANALAQGFASSIALPLISGSNLCGVLNIYSAEPEAFDPAEVALLVNLAGDVAFGIEAIRTRAENKRTLELLQASEERYRLLVDQSPYAITMYQDDRIVFANEAAVRLFGAGELADLLGRTMQSLVQPDYWPATRYRVERMLNGEAGLYPSENRFLRLDGQTVPVEVTATPFKYAGRQAIQLIALDITDRKEAEAQVVRANEFSNALLDSLPGVFYFYDENLRFLRWNKNFETVTGYTADEIARLNPLAFFDPSEQALVAERIQAVFTSGSAEVEASFVAKDGTLTPYYFTGLRTQVDGKSSLVGVGIDIAKRKQAERALHEHQKQLSLIFDTVSDVLYLLAVEPNETYRFVSINPVFLAVTGLRAEQVLGKTIEEVLPSTAHNLVKDKYRQAIQENKTVHWEEVSAYPTGTLYGEVAVTPARDAEGNCTHLIGSVHDITEIRRAHAEITKLNQELEQRVVERTAQLQTANKDLESFSYSVSHDLRAPLRAISGFAQIIARRHRASLNEEGQHYFDNIVQASDRMGHLIDDLLQYSRLGRQSVRLVPVPLPEVLSPLAKELTARLKEIGGSLEIAEDLPTVVADRTLLRQIFANLLENALTYRRPDVPAQVSVTWQAEGQAAVICVRDNGIGIPAEHHQRIFNIFQRLHSDDEYPGTGIGLATVKKSVEMLGASVRVESEIGQGSAFFIKLPLE